MKQYSVYGIGNALVDTEIQVEDTELEQLGVDKGMMTLVDESRQQELIDQLQGHLVTAKRASGGSAANTVIAVSRFGGSVSHNWNCARDDGTTGRCLVLISPDAERSMSSYLGISESLSVEQLDPHAISDSRYVYIEGYLVTSPTGRAAAVSAREQAEAAGG